MIPVWGCQACKRNLPHSHEAEQTFIMKPFPRHRAKALTEQIQKLFFPNHRGRWITFKKYTP